MNAPINNLGCWKPKMLMNYVERNAKKIRETKER